MIFVMCEMVEFLYNDVLTFGCELILLESLHNMKRVPVTRSGVAPTRAPREAGGSVPLPEGGRVTP